MPSRSVKYFLNFKYDLESIKSQLNIIDSVENVDQNKLITFLSDMILEMIKNGKTMCKIISRLKFKLCKLQQQAANSKTGELRESASISTQTDFSDDYWSYWHKEYYNYGSSSSNNIADSSNDKVNENKIECKDFDELAKNEQLQDSEISEKNNIDEDNCAVIKSDDDNDGEIKKEVICTDLEEGEVIESSDDIAKSTSDSKLQYPESKMFFDSSSGYYYDNERKLFYDSNTFTYFYYDFDEKEYKYHSQIVYSSEQYLEHFSKIDEIKQNDEFTFDLEDSYDFTTNTAGYNPFEVAPSLRLMVVRSKESDVSVGSLHIVTVNGGTVGRDPSNHIHLSGLSVSRAHAEFVYECDQTHHFYVKDLNSTKGTFVNNKRVTSAEKIEIGHGWCVQFGSVKMKCHLHPGTLTCNDCEPGIVQKSKSFLGDNDSRKSMRAQLRVLKKKYALQGNNLNSKCVSKYSDRADKRRREVGSDNPYEKTQVALEDEFIPENNKGHKMLKKLGWSKGESLGKGKHGLQEPISVEVHEGRTGLGSHKICFTAQSIDDRF